MGVGFLIQLKVWAAIFVKNAAIIKTDRSAIDS